MNRKITEEAFAYYVGLGPGRSYEAVAEHFGVSRRGIVKAAGREGWAERIAEIDRRARRRVDEQAVETLEQMGTRHLKMAQVIQGKALEALKNMPINSAMNAVRALSMAIEIERGARGEAGQGDGALIAETTRHEIRRFLRAVPTGGVPGAEAKSGAADDDW